MSNGPSVNAVHAGSFIPDASMLGGAWETASWYSLQLVEQDQDKWPEAKRQNVGNVLREKGSFTVLWNEKSLFVGVKMDDSDVMHDGTQNQTHLYLQGDCVEVFLKPKDANYYWELYGTPNMLKSVFFYPGRGRLFVPSSMHHPLHIKVSSAIFGTFNDWSDVDQGWNLLMEIPLRMLGKYGIPMTSGEAAWTILVARQNYSCHLPLKECSAYPQLSEPNFHNYEEYAEIVLKY